MPKLKLSTIQNRYNKINDLYHQFSYLITKYDVDAEMYKSIKEVARNLRLELKKFC